MKVLLVDDHPLILSALQTVIQSARDDVTVVGVETAAQAHATLAQADDFDLVLLDLALGDDDGFAVLGDLRQGRAVWHDHRARLSHALADPRDRPVRHGH